MELIRAYRQAMDEALSNEAYNIAEGVASSYEDYRYRIGIRKGMKKALQVFEDVVQRDVEEQEDF